MGACEGLEGSKAVNACGGCVRFLRVRVCKAAANLSDVGVDGLDVANMSKIVGGLFFMGD
jgi:hypothetical protein